MKRNHEDYERLARELDDDMANLEELLTKQQKAAARISLGAQDELDWAALGYTIHNLYCCFEGYFHRIAKFFENGLDPSAWHTELIDRMTLSLPEVRPNLFDKSLAHRMNEFRKFRHAFRHVYEDGLDEKRLQPLSGKVPALVSDFRPWHRRFQEAMSQLAAATREK
jgi:hypothetical protein